MRVLAAMSGGVDSAVAAARAVEAGHDVVGVHLALAKGAQPALGVSSGGAARARGCCTADDARDARRAADVLGIPFYVWDFSDRFAAEVIDDFVAEYAAGRTPNPCVRCNQQVKFAALADRAHALGFDAVATGHYARRVDTPDGPRLHRAADAAKDQSYVLAVLPPRRLATALFPLGEASSKHDVRAEAAARGLAVADKPDSTDICFVPDGDTRGWLAQRVPARPGRVVDTAGRVVGSHQGAAGHTVGQRRGLRLGTPAPDGKPRYVLSVSVVDNTLTVANADALLVDLVTTGPPTWCGPAPVAATTLSAQVRAHGEPVACEILDVGSGGAGSGLRVRLAQPLRAVAPGQLLALYDGDRVVGSALVASTR